jgi:aquaporin NIP
MRKKLLAELIGAYILVFAGTGAVMINDITGSLGHVGIALTFGFVVVALIYSFAHLSGAHFNPAVTIAFWSIGEFDSKKVIPYIGAQLFGAIAASASLYVRGKLSWRDSSQWLSNSSLWI